MADDHLTKVVKRLKEKGLTIQVGREGEIIAEPTGFISTRCPTLDYLIGRPGVPLGGITLIVGAYGSGKSTICLNLLAEAQARGAQCYIFDTEGRLDFTRLEKLGVNLANLGVAQPDTLEDTFDGVKEVIGKAREEEPEEGVLIVVDSIAGAPLGKELKGEKTALGAQSLLIRRELRVLSNMVNRQRIGLVITSQPRQRIDIGKWGRPETSWLGEAALGHAAMTTILLEEKSKFGDDPNSPIGHRIQATLIDTRIAGCDRPECRECRRKDFKRTFDFYDATGPDFWGSALEVLQECKVVTYKNGWYSYGELKPFRQAGFHELTEQHPELVDALATILRGGHHGQTSTEA